MKMHKTIRYIQVFFLSGLLLSTAVPAAHSYQLNVSGNRMSADFQNVPFSAVIADIGAKTGIRFIFLGGAAAAGYNPPLYLKYESLPIRTALEKLLSNFNYSLISDGSDTIRQVFILGAKSASKTLPATQPPFSMAARSGPTVRPAPAGNPPGQEGMQTGPGEGMQVTPGEGMQIGPGEGMQIGPGEGMQVTPGEGMQIGPPSENPPEGMEIRSQGEGAAPEGMQVGPLRDQEAVQRVGNATGAQANPRTYPQRSSRWGVRKK